MQHYRNQVQSNHYQNLARNHPCSKRPTDRTLKRRRSQLQPTWAPPCRSIIMTQGSLRSMRPSIQIQTMIQGTTMRGQAPPRSAPASWRRSAARRSPWCYHSNHQRRGAAERLAGEPANLGVQRQGVLLLQEKEPGRTTSVSWISKESPNILLEIGVEISASAGLRCPEV